MLGGGGGRIAGACGLCALKWAAACLRQRSPGGEAGTLRRLAGPLSRPAAQPLAGRPGGGDPWSDRWAAAEGSEAGSASAARDVLCAQTEEHPPRQAPDEQRDQPDDEEEPDGLRGLDEQPCDEEVHCYGGQLDVVGAVEPLLDFEGVDLRLHVLGRHALDQAGAPRGEHAGEERHVHAEPRDDREPAVPLPQLGHLRLGPAPAADQGPDRAPAGGVLGGCVSCSGSHLRRLAGGARRRARRATALRCSALARGRVGGLGLGRFAGLRGLTWRRLVGTARRPAPARGKPPRGGPAPKRR
mmetsp:Transcript_14651/g.55184  ORF Transcript_14651/g.55184 Transcript_14651/m.55184 type:complete len:299 (+) Transcript_14651:238-1134(+)